jgi:creatine kinase
MRASVHIKIPLASAHADFQKICAQYHIQPRGIHGEHSETAGGVYDISNKRRLGLSEVQCVQDMFEGVSKLIELEKSLEGKKGKALSRSTSSTNSKASKSCMIL